jgi:CRISPR system Cascade subunit CasC
MKIEIHLLQNFAPSCLNRDDTNTPKECDFGGVRRARISSQCFKRAIRQHFEKNGSVTVGTRTKLIASKIASSLIEKGRPENQVLPVIESALAGLKIKFDEGKTQYLLFISPDEVEAITVLIDQHWDQLIKLISETDDTQAKKTARDAKKDAKAALSKELVEALEKALKGSDAVDIALFGRMLADTPKGNIDAACQVGQAISTHAASLEMDFFTAVDDENPKEETGAGMLGYTGFQSACLYRYALIDVDQLKSNLGDDLDATKKAVEALLWAFCEAEPSARQNSMPAHNRPSLGLFVARGKGVPTSLANAFCKPVNVKQGSADLIGASFAAFDSYYKKLSDVYEAFDGATQAVFSDGSGMLENLSAFDKVSQRKAIAAILEVL